MASDVQVGVRLTGDSSGAVKSMALTRTELDKLDRGLRDTVKHTKDLDAGFSSWAKEALNLKGALAGVTAALAVDQLANFALEAVNSTAELGRMAEASLVSAENLQELQYAFQQFNPAASLEDVTEALSTLADRAQDATDGTASVVDDFRLIGIAADELRGKAPGELISIFAEHVKDTRDPTKRLAAVVRLLGDDLGLKLLPVLSQGADGLKRLADEAHKAGRVLDDDLVGVAEDINRQFNALTQKLDTDFKRTILTTLKDLRELAKALHLVGLSADERIAQINRRLAVAQEEIAAAPSANSTSAADRLKVMLGVPTKEELRAQFQALRDERDRLIQEQAQQTAGPMTIPVNHPAGVFMTPEQKARTLGDFEFSTFEKNPSVDLDGGLEASLPKATGSITDLEDKLKSVTDSSAKFKDSLNSTADVAARLRDTGHQVSQAFADGLTNAITSGRSFKHVLGDIIAETAKLIIKLGIELAIRTAIKIITGGAPQPSGDFFAKGGTFSGGNLLPFANGGVVDQPTPFKFASGGTLRNGIMGESGAEAIMPLKRLAGGKLGVHAESAAPTVIINDFRRSDSPPVEVSQRRGPGDQHVLEITVRDTMNKLMDRGDMDSPMERNFGVKRRGRYQ